MQGENNNLQKGEGEDIDDGDDALYLLLPLNFHVLVQYQRYLSFKKVDRGGTEGGCSSGGLAFGG